jgi:DNA modification methylase
MEKITWKNEKRKIAELIPADYNPRKISDQQKEQLRSSLEKFNLADPLVVNTDNTLIGGHQRLKVLLELGIEEIDVRVPDRPLTKDEEKELNLRLNKNTGDWDIDMLLKIDQEMLLDVGFGEDELGEFWDSQLNVEDDNFNVQKELAEIKIPQTQTGDIYQLGIHRLICGDSTDPEVIKKLVSEEKMDMIYCDPPYNIGLDYANGISTKGKYSGEKCTDSKPKGMKTDDSKTTEKYREFLDKTIKNAQAVAKENCHIFYWCDQNYIWILQNLFTENLIKIKRVCLWIKNNFNMTPQTAFNKVYEPCVYGIIGKPFLNNKYKNLNEVMNKEIGVGNQTIDDILDIINIWLIKRENAQDYEHPTQKPITLAQKPITLAQKPITRCTNLDDNILDLFGGSGSTLIAAEILKRKSFLVELEPIFCDLIIKRYEHLTGQPATKIN